MKNPVKNIFKDFFSVPHNEQRGIIFLILILITVMGFYFLMPYFVRPAKPVKSQQLNNQIAAFISKQKALNDSITLSKLQNNKALTGKQAAQIIHPFPFDPNTLTLKQALRLGLSSKQFHSIEKYRKKGGRFKKAADLKKIYTLSKSEYIILQPFIKIQPQQAITYHQIKKLNINTADSAQFVKKLKIYPKIAGRIIKFRKLLGNFYSVKQLKEVYGLHKSLYKKISPLVECKPGQTKKMELNTITFKQLLHHPYFNYSTTKLIINYRKKNKRFTSLKELKTIPGISETIFNKMQHYLYIRPLKKIK